MKKTLGIMLVLAMMTGAACSSGSLEPSHVLKAMGLSHARTLGSLRFSLGASNDEAQVDHVIDVLPAIVEKLASIGMDNSTSATPEEVRGVFRRSRIIGRRFRLVHVMLGPETIEVSTFRAADSKAAEKDEHGRVLRDNVFGTLEEDARRRDFTVNALYFDCRSGEVIEIRLSKTIRSGSSRRIDDSPTVPET
jgi:hypothetical protein